MLFKAFICSISDWKISTSFTVELCVSCSSALDSISAIMINLRDSYKTEQATFWYIDCFWGRRIHENLEGLSGIVAITDDVLFGKEDTREQAKIDHDNNLKALLERAQQRGRKFNENKCKIKTDKITYMSHLITTKGLMPDPRQAEAITNLKPPISKDEVRIFIGYIVYLSKFLPKLSRGFSTFMRLTERWFRMDEKFAPGKRVLKFVKDDYRSPNFEIFWWIIELPNSTWCKSISPWSLSYARRKTCSFCIKDINTYINFLRTNWEGVFSHFIWTSTFWEVCDWRKWDVFVEIDHKPLESKPLNSAPKRLQKMLLRLQRYNFKVLHKLSKSIIIADFLSAAPPQETDKEALIFNQK